MAQETNNELAQTHLCKETYNRIKLPAEAVGTYNGTCQMRPLTEDEIEIYKEKGCNCNKPIINTKECVYCSEFFE
jgi:hypothetical protein